MSPEIKELIRKIQTDEVTAHAVYSRLARSTDGVNGETLARIAEEEREHARFWERHSGERIRASFFKVLGYRLLAAVFGLTFVINLLEGDEEDSQDAYRVLGEEFPEAVEMFRQEEEHEAALLEMIDEERLRYIGSMVLGLNDALVELTGALAGFTLALDSSRTVGIAGLITGIAATLSMGASEYLSKRADLTEEHPFKAAAYTGIAYVITVCVLLTPFFVFSSRIPALVCSLAGAAVIIAVFTFFMAVVRKQAFRPVFYEMLAISGGVALISFVIGWLAKVGLGIDA